MKRIGEAVFERRAIKRFRLFGKLDLLAVLFDEVENPLIRVLTDMEFEGGANRHRKFG